MNCGHATNAREWRTAMLLFIDTEWADVLANELVSLALVSDCGRFEFYAERDPLPGESTDFVREVIYPLLDRGEYALGDAEFTNRLHEFFGRMQSIAKPDRVIVAYDHRNDLDLLGIALEGFNHPETPPRPAFEVQDLAPLGAAYQQAVEAVFATNPELQKRRHHALTDARVNRDACLKVRAAAGHP
jgi:3' exoribonuclease, RNase T-like